MQSLMKEFTGAAKNREEKLVRAIAGFVGQSMLRNEIELIVVSHGCKRTVEIVKDVINRHSLNNISLIEAEFNCYFEGKPKDIAIQSAKGEYIVYFDTDDMIVTDFAENLYKQLLIFNKPSWVYYGNKMRAAGYFKTRPAKVKRGQIGTMNICHKRNVSSEVKWTGLNGYESIWHYVQLLRKYEGNGLRLDAQNYVVCHVAHQLDL